MLTDQMKVFAKAIANGLLQKDAAIFAGYKEANAASQASRLMKNPEIVAFVNEIRNQRRQGEHKTVQVDLNIQHSDDSDPLEFLKTVWMDDNLDPNLRFNAAKAALPYFHGKVAEKGKKETKAEKAQDTAKSSSKFATLNSQLLS